MSSSSERRGVWVSASGSGNGSGICSVCQGLLRSRGVVLQRRGGFSIVCATATESLTDPGSASTRRGQHRRHRLHNRCRRRHWHRFVIDILIRLARLVFLIIHMYRVPHPACEPPAPRSRVRSVTSANGRECEYELMQV